MRVTYFILKMQFREDGSFSLNWQDTINISDGDKYERIFQSLSEVIYDIVKVSQKHVV